MAMMDDDGACAVWEWTALKTGAQEANGSVRTHDA
jgi:hypothetical protein